MNGDRLQIALIVSLCLAVVTPQVARADAGLDDYNVAVQLYKQNRWALAGDGFRKFLQAYPDHEKRPFARLYLGLTSINQADYKVAREVLRGFLKDYPENANVAQAKYRVAECSYLLNDLPAAKTELKTYLADHPQDQFAERALPYLGDVQLRSNDPAGAILSFRDALEKFPEGPLVDDARYGLGRALILEKQPEAALKEFETLAKGTGARAAEAQFQIGSHWFDAQELAKSAAAYRIVWERFPASPLASDARLNGGFALYRAGQFAEAATAFEQVTGDAARKVTAGYWRGMSLKNAGDPQQGVKAFAAILPDVPEKHPLADAIPFQQGVCQRQAGDVAAAETTFLAVVKSFPQGDYADDALHFATELAIEAGDYPAAAQRLQQFQQQYPQSGLRLYQQLLAGRLALGQAADLVTRQQPVEQVAALYQRASDQFEKVLAETQLPKTKVQASYYLAITRQLQNRHPDALEILQPLVAQIPPTGPHELADALVLQSDSFGQTGRWDEAATAAERYLKQFETARQRPRALSQLALAKARINDLNGSQSAYDQLSKLPGSQPLAASTGLQLAELAEQRKDWPGAASYYEVLTTLAKGTDNEAFAWRGWGWALFQQKQFAAAAEKFARVPRDFANHRLAPEAAYYHAEALREAGDAPAALAAFAAVFEKYAPPGKAPRGAEQQSPGLYAYRAGLQQARVQRQAKQIEAADRSYSMVLDRFPQPEQLDRLLDEWALCNYEAERYDEADAIFRRLVREVPESDLADNARLSLAESDLLANRLKEAEVAFTELRDSAKADAQVRERSHFQLLVLALDQRRWADVKMLATTFVGSFPQSPQRDYVDYCGFEALVAEPPTDTELLTAAEQQLVTAITKIQLDPAKTWQPRLWVLLAEIRLRLKQYPELAAIVADFKTKYPKATTLYQADEVLGRGYKQQAQFDEARQAFQRVFTDPAASKTETAAKAQFLYAETLFLQERWMDAFFAYTKVYTVYDYPEWRSVALLQAAKCDEQQGQWRDAVTSYEKLLKEFPQSSVVNDARTRLEAAKNRVTN